MKKLIPSDTVDSEEENTSNLIPSDTVDAAENVQETVGENTTNFIPEDTVDAAGNVWETVGENIRRGSKNFYKDDIKDIIDALFPVGSVFCGENSMITSVGNWELLTNGAGKQIVLGNSVPSGQHSIQKALLADDSKNDTYPVLRMYRRVS